MPHTVLLCVFFPSQNRWHMSHVLDDRWCCVTSVTMFATIFEAEGGSSFWRGLSVGVVGLLAAWSQQKTSCSRVLQGGMSPKWQCSTVTTRHSSFFLFSCHLCFICWNQLWAYFDHKSYKHFLFIYIYNPKSTYWFYRAWKKNCTGQMGRCT